ncbi:glycosyltransferase [Larsenimonas rhizosphaerae]|uniref:glycosyltransferase n=1 Tax=Larsenimonas rhizosphaerae TaxID=2944682 RepID=UPI002034A101|nr:nucleotide disphospho-sugar-binding domain-containing protein [Larsenimonas rhizosphaerae]MCM2131380.1 glycosyltransferase [Larsenimonas rhizosphaerae]
MYIGIICPPYPSHVTALSALGEALVTRGHRVAFLLPGQCRGHVSPPLELVQTDQASPLPRDVERMLARAASGGAQLYRVVKDMAAMTEALCQRLPALIRGAGIQALLVDQMEPAGGLVARRLGIPYVSVACALPLERDPALPPPFLGWPGDGSEKGIKRNQGGHRVSDVLMRPCTRVLARYGHAWRLPIGSFEQALSPLGSVCQLPAALDFTRHEPPVHLACTGPFRTLTRNAAERPAQPHIYASLGTLQGGRYRMFHRLALACARAGVSLEITHCDRLSAREVASLQRLGAEVHGRVNQKEAIERASVVVSHGGMNTVMDALAAGRPQLVLPIAFDQPGVGARVHQSGTGLRLSRHARPGALAQALERLMHEPAFTERAVAMGEAIRQAGGTRRACDLIEQWLDEK